MNKNSLCKVVIITVFLCFQRNVLSEENEYSSRFEILNNNYDHKNIVIYKTLDKQKHSYISFMKDHRNTCYLVKQDKSSSVKAHFLSVFEMLSAYIAEYIGISAHYVEILPVGLSFPGKIAIDIPATIHTVVPGSTLRKLRKNSFSGFSIKQGGNPGSSSPKGLTKRVIESMSFHEDLPPIVALDTFIANRDRNQANLMYDEKGNRFYAIDMAVIYDLRYEDLFLPELACLNIKAMIKNKIQFTSKELIALHQYQETLIRLLENFPPKKIYSLIDYYVEQAGLPAKYKETIIQKFLEPYKGAIERSYSENKILVSLLSRLLKRYRSL